MMRKASSKLRPDSDSACLKNIRYDHLDGFDIFISTCLLLPLEGTTTSFLALGSSQRHMRNIDERRYECDTLGSLIMDILKLESKLSTFCLLKV